MSPRIPVWVLAFVTVCALACGDPPTAMAKDGARPDSLEACYLELAATKTSPDLAHLVRQMCDEIFKPKRRSLFVLDPKSGLCVEWWLDTQGRYETAEVLCKLESAPEDTYTLACEHKSDPRKFSLSTLRVVRDGIERPKAPVGYDPGMPYSTLAACLRAKVR